MVFQRSHITLFPFIGHEHPFYEEMLRRINNGEKTAIRTDVKGRLLPDRGWELNQFYWSFQYWDETSPHRFRAITLFYSSKKDRIEFYEFPNDSYLMELASFFEEKLFLRGQLRSNVQIEVLRYVPLHRFTFRISDDLNTESRLIGKIKKRSRFKIAYDKLIAVSRAVDSSSSTFSVASSRGIDEKYCIFFQDEMKGEDISTVLDANNCKELLYSIGSIHRDIHCLDKHKVPEWDFPTFLENLEKGVKWITFFESELCTFLNDILDLLMEHVPDIKPQEYTFCHGDFVCSQILREGTRFSITDFDLAMRGDPYHELARLIASLKYDVPFFEKMIINSLPEVTSNLLEAINAYLAGYQERAQKTLDKKRLLWYRICVEIYYLALRFKKRPGIP